MPLIDQRVTWRAVEERLGTETDPVLRRNLEMLLTHMQAEATLDLETLMSTVAEQAHYHTYSSDGSPGPEGKAQVRAFYEAFAGSGAHKLQFDVDRLVVDRHCILTEGVMRIAYPGRLLLGRGIQVDDADAYYLYEARMAVLWPVDSAGLFTGEDSYVGSDGFAGIADRKLEPSDMVLSRLVA
jgi:SnoaL-like domain